MTFRRGFPSGPSFSLGEASRVAEVGDAVEPFDLIDVMDCPAYYDHQCVSRIARWQAASPP